MSGFPPSTPSAPTVPLPSASAPWWSHLVTGAVAIAAGVYVAKMIDPSAGLAMIGAGLTFLGVGAGVAASS